MSFITRYTDFSLFFFYIRLEVTYPVAQIVSEDKVPGERVGKRVIEIQYFNQFVSFNGVQIAVGQGSHVGRRLPNGPFFPERVSKHIPFTCSFERVQH